jgi:hypothetical protein
VYGGLECDERPYIEATREKYGFDAHYVSPDLTFEPENPALTGFRERPNMATSGFDTLLREATRLGVRALMTGEIGDACVRGSPLVLDDLLHAGRLRDAWRYLLAYRSMSLDSWPKIAALYVVAPLLPLPLHRSLAVLYVRREQARFGNSVLPAWMPGSLRGALARWHLELYLAEEAGRRTSSEARHWDLIGLCPPEAMVLPAGWPIQLARPFSDRRLQEFLLAVPPLEKFEPHPATPSPYAGSKQLIRRGLVGILPERVRTRTNQTHFAAAAVERLRRQWPALATWFAPGGESRAAGRGFIEPGPFWERVQEMRGGRLGMDCLHLGYCVGLEAWLRSLERPRQQAVTVWTSWVGPRSHIVVDRQALTPERERIA